MVFLGMIDRILWNRLGNHQIMVNNSVENVDKNREYTQHLLLKEDF
jgi:hypothetical protein